MKGCRKNYSTSFYFFFKKSIAETITAWYLMFCNQLGTRIHSREILLIKVNGVGPSDITNHNLLGEGAERWNTLLSEDILQSTLGV
jgi:hypothetical protein